MKNNNFIKEITSAIIIIILSILLIDPFQLWMPNTIQMMILISLIVAFTFFIIFVWNEKGRDEREELHIKYAGRVAFLSSASIMMLGITYQSFNHNLDLWLIGALMISIIAKIVGLIISQIKN